MLIKAKELNGFRLMGLDGEIGKVKQFYFDDKYWTIRYLVAETGDWLTSRQILISPYSLMTVNKVSKNLEVNLTKKQIEDSPSLDSDKPVSMQYEIDFSGYYGSPVYWGGLNMWGNYPYIQRDPKKWIGSENHEKSWDPHLRSTEAVSKYYIQAADGDIGHIDDFIINDETWNIRFVIIDTNKWWPGKKVLMSPSWIKSINAFNCNVIINLSLEEIRLSPEYNEESLITTEYETNLLLKSNDSSRMDTLVSSTEGM